MEYRELDIIPFKLFYKISITGDTSLLGCDKHEEIWEELQKKYKELKGDSKQGIDPIDTIQSLIIEYNLIITGVYALKVKRDEKVVEVLRSFGYRIEKDTYLDDLENITSSLNGLKVRIKREENKLDKIQNKTINIDDVMANISVYLGIDFDYNVISVTKFESLLKQYQLKIKHSNNE